mmetsp:Transcript_12278/g.8929  ORF Transcript_12278/g.8929 Transcript_12278/m.8929 type:complete len:134 (+) Transcript_12278:281-682(+)|eukprot:CAMPEP_0202971032 /NCGR_PEP_ID=MMETSP1396-20130829/23085_1 /ASSEMBLY_ACC=CAM_ASM_000872 /TAXON_ID= /ORGANISM="Pseudokeronopsis sp., Strain Brazil" /LENGTH=133 /DNA_ID=CAMNT_0049699995 /DNA_START=268 /DNA_END=669 /DNA_ORIENTATION=+
MGIILAYDCTSEESFNNVRNWVRQIDLHANSNVEKVLVGNKADLLDKKVIDQAQGYNLAQEFNMTFFETSAKSGQNVNEVFNTIAKQIKEKLAKNQISNGPSKAISGATMEGSARSSVLNDEKKKKKKNECCK